VIVLGHAPAMPYVVLARKYRPATLDELVGQSHIARALSNAIKMERVAHAFLFCGARGTGKTSTARIVAKMLDCNEGPTAQPCGKCAACVEITAGSCIDVHELDAASNRGINEIRELREGVGYAPARDRYKVYIIDEAHMLTQEAANAFLKTLEEPPPHVVFILATTDPQRLPITIRSRCQRYDFRRIRSADVVERLRAICTSEGVTLDDEALYLVAREGDGSMRDALSVLDQVIAFGGEDMRAEEVAALLGVADRNRTASLMTALVARDTPAALQAVAAAHEHGMDLRTFARTLAQETRDLLVVRLAGKAARDLVDRAESEITAIETLIDGISTAELERLAQVMLELAESVAGARHPRLVIEMGVVRLCQAAALVDVAELATRVEGLLGGGGGGGGGGARQRPGRGGGSRASDGRGRGRDRGGARAGPAPAAATHARPAPARSAPPMDAADEPPPRGEPAPRSQPTPRGEPSQTEDLLDVRPRDREPIQLRPSRPTAVPGPRSSGPVEGTARGRSLRDEDMADWQAAVVEQEKGKVIASLLDHAVVQASGPGRVTLAFPNRFHADQAAEPARLERLAAAAARAFGGSYEVVIGGLEERARTDSLSARRDREREQLRADEVEALKDDATVKRVIAAFGGTMTATISEQELAAAGLDDG